MTLRSALLLAAFLLAAQASRGAERAGDPVRGARVPSSDRARAEEIRALILRRDCAHADSLARVVMREATAVDAASSLDSARVAFAMDLSVEATRCFGRTRAPEALELARHAFAVHLRADDDPLDRAWSQSNLGAALLDAGAIAEGREVIETAHGVILASATANDTLRGRDWNRMGVALEASHQFDDAEAAYRKALEIRTRLFGADHLETLQALNNVAQRVSDGSNPRAAIPLLERLVEGRRRVLGDSSREVAAAYSALGESEYRLGRTRAAREHSARALEIFEQVGPSTRYAQAGCRQRLGTIANAIGDYEEAERQYESAAELLRQTEGVKSPNVGQLLTDQGNVARARGDYERAEERIRAGLALMEGGLGPEHVRLYAPLTHLAHVLKEEGRNDDAKAIYERALRIFEAVNGPEHRELVGALAGLADCEEKLGRPEVALELRQRALRIAEASEGSGSLRVQGSRLNVAISLRDLGRLKEAETEARRALAALAESPSREAPEVAQGTLVLSRILGHDPARSREAMDEALHAEAMGREHLRSTARYLSEREALAYAASRPRGTPAALSLLLARPATFSGREADVADACVRGRALVEDELLRRLRAQARIGAGAFDSLRTAIEEARAEDPAEADRLERELAARVPADLGTAPGFAEIRRALPPGSSLAAFVRFEREPIDDAPFGPWYALYLLSADDPTPRFLPIAPADSIDALVRAWRGEMRAAPNTPLAELDAMQAGLALRHLVWDRWSDARRGDVYLVPDGELLLINFGALPLDPEPGAPTRYVIEDAPLLHYLSSERDLLSIVDERDEGPLLALGDPDFDGATEARGVAARTAGGSSATDLARGVEDDCEARASLQFHRLPGASGELDDVARACREHARVVRVTRGRDATERSLIEEAGEARSIHLATHAFYVDCEAPLGRIENPLLRSGIALAGVNRRMTSGVPASSDGLMTAAEIGALDLSRIDSAILSACETGVGMVIAGEGVLGLRRAFKVAGVRSLVSSLWTVDDRATREWMRRFYDDASPGMARRVRDTERELLLSRRARGESTHPFYWAAFVATGD